MTDERDKSAEKPAEDGAPSEELWERAGAYRVALPEFEGPLDLLLHLIQEHELDILDIPIAFVASKYVEYITLMQELNIDLASEYLVMAATLAHIKSKLLLPVVPEDQEDGDEVGADPRAELVRRLLEYQKYKHAAEQFGTFDLLGRDVFTRGAAGPSVDGPAPLAPIGLFKLLDAFQRVLERAQRSVDHQVEFERLSITDRINELVDLMRGRRAVPFEDLFGARMSRADLVVTFLALLEMTRLRMTRLTQGAPLEPIMIELTLGEDVPFPSGPTTETEAPRAPFAPEDTVDNLQNAGPSAVAGDAGSDAEPDRAEDGASDSPSPDGGDVELKG